MKDKAGGGAESEDLSEFISHLKTIHLSLIAAALIVIVSLHIALQDTRWIRAEVQINAFHQTKADKKKEDERWALEVALAAWRANANMLHPRTSEPFSGWLERVKGNNQKFANNGKMGEKVIHQNILNDLDPELYDALLDYLFVGLKLNKGRFLVSNFSAKSSWGIEEHDCGNVMRSKTWNVTPLSDAKLVWNSFSKLKVATLGPDLHSMLFSLAIIPLEEDRSDFIWIDDVRIRNRHVSIEPSLVGKTLSLSDAKIARGEVFILLNPCILDKEREISKGHKLELIADHLNRNADILYFWGDFKTKNTFAYDVAKRLRIILVLSKTSIQTFDARPAISNLIGGGGGGGPFDRAFPELNTLIVKQIDLTEQRTRSIQPLMDKVEILKESELLSNSNYINFKTLKNNFNSNLISNFLQIRELEKQIRSTERFLTQQPKNLSELKSAIFDRSVKFPRRTEDSLELQGLSLHINDISFLGSLYLIIHQLYYFLHLRVLVNRVCSTKGSIEFGPWIGIYDDNSSRFLTFISTCIIPTGVSALVLYYMVLGGGDDVFFTVILYFLGFGENSFNFSVLIVGIGMIWGIILAVQILLQRRKLMKFLSIQIHK